MSRVIIAQGKQSLTITWNWKGKYKPTTTTLWSVRGMSQDGNHVLQLGYKAIPGSTAAQFVFDFSKGSQINLPSEASLKSNSLRANFPEGGLVGLGDKWKWEATITENGNDVDSCTA